MNYFLLDEEPIFANRTLAKYMGLVEAIILQQINFWINVNKENNINFYDGKYWTYNSIKNWHEQYFNYISLDTIKRAFAKLEKEGYLLIGNSNKDRRDRTKWYTINEDRLKELYMDKEKNNMKSSNVKNISNPDPLTNNKKNNEYNNSLHNSNKLNNGIVVKDKIDKREDNERDLNDILEELKNKTDYDYIASQGDDSYTELFLNVLLIISDILVMDDDEYVNINHNKILCKYVKERFNKVDCNNIRDVIMVIRDTPYKIRNMKNFVITCIYNNFNDRSLYYESLVKYDFYNKYKNTPMH